MNKNIDPITKRFTNGISEKKPCVQCGLALEVGRGLCRKCYNAWAYQEVLKGRYLNGKYRPNKEQREEKERRRKRASVLKAYGITIEDYEALNAAPKAKASVRTSTRATTQADCSG